MGFCLRIWLTLTMLWIREPAFPKAASPSLEHTPYIVSFASLQWQGQAQRGVAESGLLGPGPPIQSPGDPL